jgi:hypothetical protein
MVAMLVVAMVSSRDPCPDRPPTVSATIANFARIGNEMVLGQASASDLRFIVLQLKSA